LIDFLIQFSSQAANQTGFIVLHSLLVSCCREGLGTRYMFKHPLTTMSQSNVASSGESKSNKYDRQLR